MDIQVKTQMSYFIPYANIYFRCAQKELNFNIENIYIKWDREGFC